MRPALFGAVCREGLTPPDNPHPAPSANCSHWHVSRKILPATRQLSRFRTIPCVNASAAGTSRWAQAMNIHQSYALTSRPDTNRLLRWWISLTRTALFGAIILADISIIIAMACLTGVGYHLAVHDNAGELSSFLEVGALSAVIFVILNVLRSEYALPNFFAFKHHLRRTFQLWNMTVICLLAVGFLAKITVVYSRGWMVVFYVSTICVLLALRYLFVQATIRGSRAGLISAQRIFLVGTGRHVGEFVARYQPQRLGVNVVGCHFLTPLDEDAPEQIQRETFAGDIEAAVHGVRSVEPDAIFLVMPWSATDAISRCAESFLTLPVEIHLGPEQVLDRFENISLSKFGPMASLQLTRIPLSRLERFEKRALDLLLAGTGLLLLTPVLILVAIMIKLDSEGPVLFLQHRYGFNQKPFRIIKFRTMRTLDDGAVIAQAKRDDPRVTKIGQWLRGWNIDEIPQLFNVLMGDMSLVGPRPHALSHNREYEQRISLYARRHNVKPGITGWAQIHGFRGETDSDDKMRKRVECDLYYIDNWSLWLDIQILIRTVFSRSSYRNAY
jgi:Undecaprenyl-phosphate glucose phosphotransferase